MFPSEVGTPLNPSNMHRGFKALILKAGVPDLPFHNLRHTHASILILRGADAKKVADRLGHTDPAFTLKTYAHRYEQQRREIAFGFQDLFGPDEQDAAGDDPDVQNVTSDDPDALEKAA